MAARLQPRDQSIPVDALDRVFTGGIDLGHDHRVGIVEAGAEFLEQIVQPRIAMGLDHGDDISFGAGTGSVEHGGNFHRVMAVIVNHHDPVDLAGAGKAPFDAAEPGQGAARDIVIQPHLLGDGDRGQRILDIMGADHGQFQTVHRPRIAGRARGDHHIEARSRGRRHEVDGADIRLWAHTVGDDAAVGHFGDQRLDICIVDA